ncbi:MAG: hypothetical protein PGN07_10230 [Aeromicrobium erythreum]
MRRRVLAGALLALPVASSCAPSVDDAEPLPPGRVDAREYRSAAAQVGELTIQQAREGGFVDDPRLAELFRSEGGAAEPTGRTCLYAVTLYRRTLDERSYRGTARLCFDAAGRLASADRNRADLRGTPSPPTVP